MADIFRTMHQDEALVVKSILESAGLHAEIVGEHILDVYPIFFPEAGGIRISVPDEEAEDALDIIEDYRANRESGGREGAEGE
ncbi:MAG: putative signal transducing protein [Rectinemataceae bacterium]